MGLQFDTWVLPLLISAGVTGVLGYLLWQRSEGRLFSADGGIALVQFAVLFWAVGQALLLSATGLGPKLVGVYLSEVGIAATGPAYLLFALKYTGTEDWLTRSRAAVIVGAPVVGLVVLLTNAPPGFHDLFLADPVYDAAAGTLSYGHGPARWGHAAYMWGMHMAGNYFLFGKFLASRNVYRKRTFVIMVSDLAIVITTAVSLSPFDPVGHMALGPAVYAVFALLSILVIVSYRTLDYIPVERTLAMFSSRSKNLAPAARDVIMEEIESGVIVVDHKNRIVDINPLGRKMVSGDDDRIVGKRLGEIVDDDVYVDGPPPYRDPSVTEGSFSGVWVETPDGERRCFDATVTPLTDDEEVTGRVLLIHDVTQREARKQKLEERTVELERQNDRLEDFASIVSHDLRNPLNVAKGAVDLAERKSDPSYYEKLRRSHERMETIIDDVLTLARQGRTVEETTEVDLATIATDAWNHVDTKDAAVDIGVSCTVEADRSRLTQMFENFFRNAVEHGGADVTVTVGPLEDGFFVEDDGPGIADQHRNEVLSQGFTTNESGTGFGLSIIKTIVDAHGWDIVVTEGREGGARFEITDVSTTGATTATEQGTA